MNLARGGQEMWNLIVETLEVIEQAKDLVFATDKTRAANREKNNACCNWCWRRTPRENWIARLNKAGVPFWPGYRMDQVFADPQSATSGDRMAGEHPALGTVNLVRAPMKLDGLAPPRGRRRNAVSNRRGLTEFGIDAAALAVLKATGAI